MDVKASHADGSDTLKHLADMNDGTHAERVAVTSVTNRFREAFESYDSVGGNRWVESKAAGDLVFLDGNAAAASYLVISKDPLSAGTETLVEIRPQQYFQMPTEIAFGAHLSQRTLGQEFSIEAVDTGTPLADVSDIAISAISQATTVLTIDFATPHGLSIGKSIGVRGCSNPLANYPSLVVATVPTPLQITCTAGPGGTIASQTITNPAGAKGFVYFRERLGRARNGVSQIFENATATNASLYIRSESGDALPSGTIAGSHSTTINTSASVQLVNSAYTYAFGPTTEYRLLLQSDRVQWADSAVDATTQTTSRLVRTQVAPDPSESYKLRIRATNNKGLTVPVAQIISAVKTGTTTAVITTDVPHGLVTGDPVVVYGIRDQGAAAFPNLLTATAVGTVGSTTTFEIVIGTAASVTSYGGYVARVQGGNLMSALGGSAVIAQSAVLSTLADGTRQLVLTGNTNWASLLIGDMVHALGVREATAGVTLGVDGPWKVANVATTALTLVLPFAGQRTLPADFASTNCGGGVIKRTCLRMSFVRVFDYERLRTESLARPSGDMSAAAPVVVQNTPAVTISSGTVTTVSALTGGGVAEDAAAGNNPVIVGGVARAAASPVTIVAGDAIRDTHSLSGAKVTRDYAVPEATWNYSAALTTTTAAAVQTAAGASLKRFPVALQAINTGASATDLILLDGVTERWRITLPVNIPVSIIFPVELIVTANTALNVNLSAAVTSVRVNIQGYTGA